MGNVTKDEFILRAQAVLQELAMYKSMIGQKDRQIDGTRFMELVNRAYEVSRWNPKPEWTPFELVKPENARMPRWVLDNPDVLALWEREIRDSETYMNSRYMVSIRRQKPSQCDICDAGYKANEAGMHVLGPGQFDSHRMDDREDPCNKIHGHELRQLSIRAIDRGHEHDWRDFQRIKNELLGPEEEAVEIYPPESKLVDTSNQYWLWSMEGCRLHVGFDERRVAEESDGVGNVQRPFEEDARPSDLKIESGADLAREAKERGRLR